MPAPGIIELGQELSRSLRLLHMLRSQGGKWIPYGLDGAAFGLLATLVRLGPLRQGELADNCLLDPSTVSRQVGQLVRNQLVTRQPSIDDGRAVLLAATASGQSLALEAGARKEELFREMLADWSPDDVAALVVLLGRLNDAFEGHRGKVTPGAALNSAQPSPQEN